MADLVIDVDGLESLIGTVQRIGAGMGGTSMVRACRKTDRQLAGRVAVETTTTTICGAGVWAQ